MRLCREHHLFGSLVWYLYRYFQERHQIPKVHIKLTISLAWLASIRNRSPLYPYNIHSDAVIGDNRRAANFMSVLAKASHRDVGRADATVDVVLKIIIALGLVTLKSKDKVKSLAKLGFIHMSSCLESRNDPRFVCRSEFDLELGACITEAEISTPIL